MALSRLGLKMVFGFYHSPQVLRIGAQPGFGMSQGRLMVTRCRAEVADLEVAVK